MVRTIIALLLLTISAMAIAYLENRAGLAAEVHGRSTQRSL